MRLLRATLVLDCFTSSTVLSSFLRFLGLVGCFMAVRCRRHQIKAIRKCKTAAEEQMSTSSRLRVLRNCVGRQCSSRWVRYGNALKEVLAKIHEEIAKVLVISIPASRATVGGEQNHGYFVFWQSRLRIRICISLISSQLYGLAHPRPL